MKKCKISGCEKRVFAVAEIYEEGRLIQESIEYDYCHEHLRLANKPIDKEAI